MSRGTPIRSSLLERAGIPHEFGERDGSTPPADLATGRQVHGTAPFWPSVPGRHAIEADVVLARPGVSVGVVTADCVPVLFASPRAQLAAAAHAGWRGTLAGAMRSAMQQLESAGATSEDLWVAIGPAIRPCCYEVSADLAERFAAHFGPSVVVNSAGKPSLDLQEANALELVRLGVDGAHIDVLRRCTRCEMAEEGAPRFHSFRRDGKAAGRQISYVRPAAKPIA